jgi:hypothetical protein
MVGTSNSLCPYVPSVQFSSFVLYKPNLKPARVLMKETHNFMDVPIVPSPLLTKEIIILSTPLLVDFARICTKKCRKIVIVSQKCTWNARIFN